VLASRSRIPRYNYKEQRTLEEAMSLIGYRLWLFLCGYIAGRLNQIGVNVASPGYLSVIITVISMSDKLQHDI
jgi:hypothetical protein